MKKRSLLVTLILAFALMLTACGEKNPFPGTWKATCDLTEYIENGIGENMENTLIPYMDFEDLTMTINFVFTDNEVEMSVDQDSVEAFKTKMLEDVSAMFERILITEIESAGLTYEEYLGELGVDAETMMENLLDEIGVVSLLDEAMDELCTQFQLSGRYMYEDGVLTIIYEDNTYEEMQYIFEGDRLTIEASDGEDGLRFVCEKQD